MTEPRQKPGASRQDYGTPRALIDAVIQRFGPLDVDLAATGENAKASVWITPERDSLTVRWGHLFRRQRAWLNPPFDDIATWTRKCAFESHYDGVEIILLTPASVGSNWFMEHVHGRAAVFALNPRLRFEGCKDAYPKDCMLSVFGAGLPPGFDVWRWS